MAGSSFRVCCDTASRRCQIGAVLGDDGATLSYEPVPEGGSLLTVELPKAADAPTAAEGTHEPGTS